jgi:hypothetical protein
LGIVEVQLFEGELAVNELLAAAMFFMLSDILIGMIGVNLDQKVGARLIGPIEVYAYTVKKWGAQA